MKSIKFLVSILLINSAYCIAQNTWIQKADVGGGDRFWGVGFSINGKGYCGTGYSTSSKDFWEYDPVIDTWTQRADFAGGERNSVLGFAIGGKGYVGTGYLDDYMFFNDFWEYDPALNTWTQKANYPGGGREGLIGFSIGSKGYAGTGDNGIKAKKDFWEYDPSADVWTNKANFGGGIRSGAFGFSNGNKGYVGLGNNTINLPKDFWEYDPATNVWIKKAVFEGAGRTGSSAFVIGDKGYVGTGYDSANHYLIDFWEYDFSSNSWSQKADFAGVKRSGGIGFSLNGRGYIGTGVTTGSSLKDFWEYTPDCDSLIVYADADGDGYGDATSNTIICDSILPFSYVYNNTDCNDADATINPGATEVCSNGADDNCNGQVDENCCSTPTGLTTTNITSTSAQLNWNTVASASKYTLQYKRDSTGIPWTSVTIIAPTTTQTITGLLTGSKYKWRVRSVCGSEKSAFSPVVKFTTLLRLGEEAVTQTSLLVHPNPIITSGTISFSIEQTASVSIGLVDITGRKLQTVLDETLEAGKHQLQLNRNQLAAGIYFLKVQMNGEDSILKIAVQ
ncbi:MAG: fibronectin type III domain-containing protein [Chitinophagales bacterium]|nr:fibronectin type III domain-containing protein [Chitinophagales bacterium]